MFNLEGVMIIMEQGVDELFELLFCKDNNLACTAMKKLQKECEETSKVYSYMDRLSDMLDNDNSYIRTRALTLIAYNARWDTDNKVDEVIDKFLKHILDVKPITARQCIKLLPIIAQYRPELRQDIIQALKKADTTIYKESMQPLVYNDIKEAVDKVTSLS